MKRNFHDLLQRRWSDGFHVCVGLDSERAKIPDRFLNDGELGKQLAFNKWIIDQTHQYACAFKPNSAFYEAEGEEGAAVLKRTIEYAHRTAPGVAVILDAKRGDIGNTNDGYVRSAFDRLKADAITLSPYMGSESLKPFLERSDKGIFLLCRTSNPGAGEFQDLLVDGSPLYQVVASHVAASWNENGNCGVVVGATNPEELSAVRRMVGDLPILIPGVGAQGGDLEKTVKAGKNSRGAGMIINSSRGIIFAPDPGAEAKKLNDSIVSFL